MSRFIRTWMLWLLMLVLPLQALANAAQLSCGIGEHHQGQSKRLKHDFKPVKQGAGSVQVASHSTCGACATGCCASAAMPGSQAALALSIPGPDPYFAIQPAFHAGHIPDGPERPPRRHAS